VVGFDWSRAGRIVGALSPAALTGSDIVFEKLFAQARAWLEWTIAYQRPHEDTRSNEGPGHLYEWNNALGGYLGALGARAHQPAFQQDILAPIFELSRREEPDQFLAPLLTALIRSGIAFKDRPPLDAAVANFDACADRLYERASGWGIDDEHPWRGMQPCLGLIGLTGHLGALFPDSWPYVEQFRDRLHAWFERVGRGANGFASFIATLNTAGDGLYPDPALNWLAQVANERRSDEAFWKTNDNARKASRYLADQMKHATGEQVPLLRQILGVLASHGDALAAELLTTVAGLERRS